MTENPFAKYRPQQNRFAKYKALPPGFVLDGPPQGTPIGELLPAQEMERVSNGNRFAKYRRVPTTQHAPGVTGFAVPGAQSSQQELQSNLAEKVNRDGSLPELYRNRGDLAFVQGATLGAGDEILSGVAAPLATIANRFGLLKGDALPNLGDNYDQGVAMARATQARFEAEHPGYALANELAGGLATAQMPAGFVTKGGGVLAKTGKGIATGAAYGAAQGFNGGTDWESRTANAKAGAMSGAIVGGAIAPVGHMVGKGYQGISNRIANRALAKEAGVKPKVFREVSKAYADDAATGFTSQADSADMLLNRGNQLQVMAEEIASQPGQGRNLLIKAIGNQQAGAGQRTLDTVNRTIGNDAGRVTNASAIEAQRKAAGQAYNLAKMHNGRFDISGLRHDLDGMISESDGSVRSALMRVRRLQIFQDGVIGNASAAQLHAGRMAIDDMMSKPGVGSNAARLLREMRGQVDDALKGNVPGWQQADEAYSAVMQRKEALDAGREVFRRSYGSPQELIGELRQMSPAARQDFAKGARDSISEIMGSSRNDAAAARRELMDKGWNREKLQILIGKNAAAELDTALTKEAQRSQAAQNILGNSRTALRQNANKAFPGANGRDVDVSTSFVGLGLQFGKAALNKLNGNRRAELSRQAADLLTRKASDVEPLLREAQRRLGRRLNVREQIETVASALAYSALPSPQ